MSTGSTLRRRAQRIAGMPVSKKEKLRVALFGLVKIAIDPTDAKKTATDTLYLLGIKPKETKSEPKPE